ncbi:hypothetical protein [Candidatus Lokiarchaeum ossiferum]|uniref:hypothetical protein n=1 Tax=Candidatus Lokiarchaeum ossiferum TaxID=2951803 RepID=UPI00352C78D1
MGDICVDFKKFLPSPRIYLAYLHIFSSLGFSSAIEVLNEPDLVQLLLKLLKKSEEIIIS